MDELVYFFPEGHQAHTEHGHPERPDRVEAMRKALQKAGWWEPYPCLQPVQVPEDVLHNIHDPQYLQFLKSACRKGLHLDADTYTTEASWELALNAAGGATAVASTVWQGTARRGYALTRPPGHHASQSRGMGFCLLNNVSLATEYLIQKDNARRIAIVDLDLHHGNGTQDIFWQRGDVLFISTHQSPFYPGTGQLEEQGAGAGKGATVNLPLPPFSGDQAFLACMDQVILPLLDRFSPEMILVSTGFDAHWRDPLGYLLLTGSGYAELVARLARWADLHCEGKISLILEGGYDLEAAAACAQAAVATLVGKPWHDFLGPPAQPESMAWKGMVQKALRLWDL